LSAIRDLEVLRRAAVVSERAVNVIDLILTFALRGAMTTGARMVARRDHATPTT
jgi:hypothetical protein